MECALAAAAPISLQLFTCTCIVLCRFGETPRLVHAQSAFEHPLLVMCLFASVLIAEQINAFRSIPKTVSVKFNCKRFEFQKREIPMDFSSVMLYKDKGKYTKGESHE
jgi:hypothetical protein